METEVDKKSGSGKKIAVVCGIIFAIALLGLTAGYFICNHYYKTHFMKGTVVNGINVSKMTIEDLNKKVQGYTLTIIEKSAEGEKSSEELKGTEIGLNAKSNEKLQQILDEQKGNWLLHKGKTYTLDKLTGYDQTKFDQKFESLNCLSEDFVKESVNAYVQPYDAEKGTFDIVPEVVGNQVDKEKAKQTIADAVVTLQDSVNLEELDCYLKPEITAESPELTEFQAKLNQYASTNITYTFDTATETLTGADICNWLAIDYDNRQVTLDQARVEEYVAYLKWNYDTIFGTRQFTTSYGATVTVAGGDYGWWMNKEQEVAELAAMIEAGQSGERKPVYYQEAANYGDCDYGNTYIEINLTSQHLFVYVNGERKLESDFCSGNSSNGHATPEGTYAMTYVERYAVLHGDNYETPVSYWMPFNEDIGLHDATWKTEFGKNFYTYAGSHGCINLPYNVAKAVFQYAYKGMPVICYKLPGTESTSVTIQTNEEKAQSAIDAINEIATSEKPAKQTVQARAMYNELNSAVRACVTNYGDLLAYEAMY